VFAAVNTPLRLLIADAYIGNQPGAIDRIVGGPAWVCGISKGPVGVTGDTGLIAGAFSMSQFAQFCSARDGPSSTKPG
jgi:hypothetical protein